MTYSAKDAHGNPVSGLAVTLVVSGVTETSFTDFTDNLDGTYSGTLTGTKAGEARLMPQVNGTDAAQAAASLTLTAGELSPVDSSVAVSPAAIVADGTTPTTVTYSAKDAHGNPMSGLAVTLVVSGVTETSFTDFTDNLDGTYSGTLTGTKAGEARLMPQVNGTDAAPAAASLTLTAGPADQAESAISTDSDGYFFGDDMTLTVKLKDKQQNPVADMESELKDSVNVPNATLQGNWVTGDNPGEYTATYTTVEAGDSLNASLALTGWSGPQKSDAYRIVPPPELEPMSGTITVNGRSDFSTTVTTKFPTTGFKSAYFKLNEDNFSGGVSNYTLKASCGGDKNRCNWVSVEADGTVRFTAAATTSTKKVTVTAMSKAVSEGKAVFYEFTVGKWFSSNASAGLTKWEVALTSCAPAGLVTLEGIAGLSPGATGQNIIPRSEHAGSLAGEWGNFAEAFTEFSYLNPRNLHTKEPTSRGEEPWITKIQTASLARANISINNTDPAQGMLGFIVCEHSI